MPPNRKPGSVFSRRRREILAMVAGALGALGLWLFVGGPDRVAIGTGTFSSPDTPAAGRGAEVPAAGDPAVIPGDSVADRAVGEAAEEDGSADRDRTVEEGSARGGPAVADAGGAEARPDTRGDGRDAAPLTVTGSRTADSETRAPMARAATTDPAPDATGSGAAPESARSDADRDRGAEAPPGRRPTPRAESPNRDPPVAPPPDEEAVPATTVEARVAAEVAVAAYARAVESGDMAALRRAHPGLTAENEAAWRRVFENGETFVAVLRIAEFGANGTEARAGVRGSCHFYDLTLRRFVDVPVEFDLYLHHDGRTWRPVLASGESPDRAP